MLYIVCKCHLLIKQGPIITGWSVTHLYVSLAYRIILSTPNTVFLPLFATRFVACTGGIWVSFVQPYVIYIYKKTLHMGDLSHTFIVTKYTDMLYMHFNHGLSRHFQWKLNAPSTLNCTVYMSVYINSSPGACTEPGGTCRYMGICVVFMALATGASIFCIYAVH